MRVTLLCSDPAHPVVPKLKSWLAAQPPSVHAALVHQLDDVCEGDFLFLISCTQIIRAEERRRFRHALVIHSSDLPEGRGWSPQAWTVLRGDNHLTVSLLEADDPVDSGRIFKKARVELNGTELFDEIHEKLYSCWLELLDWAIVNADSTEPLEQVGGASYFRKRTPEDSRIDPQLNIAEQFDLLRICDPVRFPAFMDMRGRRYEILLRPVEQDKANSL